MLLQPPVIAVPFHTLPAGKIVGVTDQSGPRLGLTIEALQGGTNVDIVLLPTATSAPTTNFAAWDGSSLELDPALIFDDVILNLDTTATDIGYERQAVLKEGCILLVGNRPALCSIFPQQGPAVRLLHWLNDGTRARSQLSGTLVFPKWSLWTRRIDAPPQQIFST